MVSTATSTAANTAACTATTTTTTTTGAGGMVSAGFSPGSRCRGPPPSTWSNLTKTSAVPLSEHACKVACEHDSACRFAVYNTDNKGCTGFITCVEHAEAGKVYKVWKKPAVTFLGRVRRVVDDAVEAVSLLQHSLTWRPEL